MSDTLPTHARTLPLYLPGLTVGRDIGLRLALETIVREVDRQRDLAVIAKATTAPGESSFRNAARHEYARARLSDVATVVAVYFRRAT
jgi:hypothetical protein